MKNGYYLKKVILILGDREITKRFDVLSDALRQNNICCQVFHCEESDSRQIYEECTDRQNSTNEKCSFIVDNTMLCGGCLWITDQPETARKAAAEGKPILIFYHSGNQSAVFPQIRFGMENPEELDVEYLDRIYRRYAGIPWDIMETERCLIRETTESDVDSFYCIYQDPSITRFTEGLYPDVQEEKQYVREYIEKVYTFYEFGVWTVVLKDTGEVIGRAGFSYRAGYERPELGFIIGVPWQRQGIAYEVCQAILNYGLQELGFDQVQALVEPNNCASLALCGKLGFLPEGKVKQQGQEYILLTREGTVAN